MGGAEAMPGALGEFLADRIPRLAAQAHRRFPMVPVDDFSQAMWVRALERKAKLAKHLREGQEGFIWSELRSAATRLGQDDNRFRRSCKAKAAGYRTFDEEFYSTGTLANLVTALTGGEGSVAVTVQQATLSTDAAGIHVQGGQAGDYMVMLMDARAALDRLPAGQRRILWQYYGLPVDEDTDEGRWERRKLASSMGLTYEALRQRAHRALRALQRELGGENPWRRQDREEVA